MLKSWLDDIDELIFFLLGGGRQGCWVVEMYTVGYFE